MGEAQDLDPRLVRMESLVPVRVTSANFVFQGHVVHWPVKEPSAVIQPAEQAEAESINYLEVEDEQEEGNMVTRRTMTIYRFIPGAYPAA